MSFSGTLTISASSFDPSASICAYAGTGKDSFLRDLQTNKLHLKDLCYGDDDAKWIVYADTQEESTSRFVKLFDVNNCKRIRRYAHADTLKDHSHEYLKLLDVATHSFELVKNTAQFEDPNQKGVYRTIRGWYIYLGGEARKTKPLIWSDLLTEKIEEERLRDKIIDCTTDWRFTNELRDRKCRISPKEDYIFQPASEILTIRLFRSEVSVMDDISEHDLDKYKTKYLLISNRAGEFDLACERFPQYRDFKPIFRACLN